VSGLPPGSYEINVEESGYDTVRTKAQLEGPLLKLVLYLTREMDGSAPKEIHGFVRDLRYQAKAREEYQKEWVPGERTTPRERKPFHKGD